jgi:hypothetical protein
VSELVCDVHLGDHEPGPDCRRYPRCKRGVVYCGLLGVFCHGCGDENATRNFKERNDRIRELVDQFTIANSRIRDLEGDVARMRAKLLKITNVVYGSPGIGAAGILEDVKAALQ